MYLHRDHHACIFYDPSCIHHYVHSGHNDHNDHNNNDHDDVRRDNDHPYGGPHDHHPCRISSFYHLSRLFKQTLYI